MREHNKTVDGSIASTPHSSVVRGPSSTAPRKGLRRLFPGLSSLSGAASPGRIEVGPRWRPLNEVEARHEMWGGYAWYRISTQPPISPISPRFCAQPVLDSAYASRYTVVPGCNGHIDDHRTRHHHGCKFFRHIPECSGSVRARSSDLAQIMCLGITVTIICGVCR